ncbi:polysaccharide deacetylase family protein [Leucobacter albus]|uniref:Polysaccharide deacetylase family protein n=1 Tax=Leucobacter albus TaxID=272210 RepID=A0ABW3TS10_9MICO
MTHQAYGPLIGVRRILGLLEHHGVRSTFFIPGYTADRYPGVVRDIAAAGHEIAHHGYHHVTPTTLTPAERVREIVRGSDTLERISGQRPVGYRAPMWDLSWDMPALLAAHGFVYESSLMDSDLPYPLLGTAKHSPSGTDLIEIPIQWALDDWEQYCYLPGVTELGPIQTPGHAVELWRSELHGTRRFGGCWVLTNHPFLSGRPGRAAALDALLAEVSSLSDVWLAPMIDIAAHTATLNLPARVVEAVEPPAA